MFKHVMIVMGYFILVRNTERRGYINPEMNLVGYLATTQT